MPNASPRNGAPEQVTRLAAQLAAIASHLSATHPDAQLLDLLEHARRSSEAAAAHAPALAGLLANLTMALQTWRDVWPRLGAQREFRLAVAREARLWSERFAQTPSGSSSAV